MNRFSAKEPSLGYHYQVRYALYLLLKAKDKESPFVKLENLDDVEILDANQIELHQTKFHNKKAANLTDSSVDIWKTIRVWSELALIGDIDLDNILLLLVTTSKTSTNSCLYDLSENKKTEEVVKNVIEKLNNVSNSSTNQTLKDAFESYNKLSVIQKEKLVKSIWIEDNALDFEGLKKSINNELQLTFLPEHISTAFNDLEGWWYDQCIQHLEGKVDYITFDDTRRYISYLNDKYKTDSLPIDMAISSAKIGDEDFEDMLFVEQLKNINIGRNVIGQAKRDFFRANEQRSKWLREKLLHPQEEIDYEFKLKDDWRGKFAVLQDDIESIEEENEIKNKCKTFYTSFYVSSNPGITIRPRVMEVFLIKGSCHMLADKKDIVWNPNLLNP